MPELSIITINYNNLPGLQKTMQSVFEQTFTDYEYIIIDGGSTDGSKEYIELHANKLANWVSENDHGIYHAMNKGIDKAKGKYLNFLNSGDLYSTNDVLTNIHINLREEDILYGDSNMIYDHKTQRKKYDFPIDFFIMSKGTFVHNATFIKKEVFEKIGNYSLDYKIVSDWHFFMKAIFRHNCTLFYLDQCIVDYDMNGISSTQEQVLGVERKSILETEYVHEMSMIREYKVLQEKYDRILNRFPIKQISKLKIRLAKLLRG